MNDVYIQVCLYGNWNSVRHTWNNLKRGHKYERERELQQQTPLECVYRACIECTIFCFSLLQSFIAHLDRECTSSSSSSSVSPNRCCMLIRIDSTGSSFYICIILYITTAWLNANARKTTQWQRKCRQNARQNRLTHADNDNDSDGMGKKERFRLDMHFSDINDKQK